MKKAKQDGWIAVKENSQWDKNEQIRVFGTWKEIVNIAKEKSKEENKEVRISNSVGFNNQGHYVKYDN